MEKTGQNVAQAAPAHGLTTAEAQARMAEYGENAIEER